VWWLQLALDAFEHHLLESMRATRAWIQAKDARMHPRPAAAIAQVQQTSQPAAACDIMKMWEGAVRMRAGILSFSGYAGARSR